MSKTKLRLSIKFHHDTLLLKKRLINILADMVSMEIIH